MEKDLVLFLAKSLVNEPDAVSVEENFDGEKRILRLSVAESDIGKIIGKEGRIVKAFRTLLAASNSKNRYFLEIVDK